MSPGKSIKFKQGKLTTTAIIDIREGYLSRHRIYKIIDHPNGTHNENYVAILNDSGRPWYVETHDFVVVPNRNLPEWF